MKSFPASDSRRRPTLFTSWALLSLFAFCAAPLAVSAQTRVFAPYIDMSLGYDSDNLAQISQQSGIKDFTLAFVVSSGTQAQWGGLGLVSADTAIAPEINALRAQGGDVIISFGGEAGTELAISVTSVPALQAQYQSVITKYGVTSVDFDIEGGALSNTAANDRRNQAIAGLQAANPGLIVSYTLPVGTYGLDPVSITLLQNAKSHGVNVAVVNIMAMDYGSATSPTTMGQNAIDATNNTIAQLATNGLTTNIGLTVLIGGNDTKPEIFTLSDAQLVENDVAGNKQVTRLTFWEVPRDFECPGDALKYDSNTCSGVTQTPWEFSQIFEPFAGGGEPSVAVPAFSPAGGTYSSAQNVTLSDSTSGAAIRYTTDGSLPSETNGTLYTGPVSISSTATLNAIAYKSGDLDSAIASATYTIGVPPPQVAIPTFSPAGGTYSSTQSVILGDSTSGASIRYTTDGSTPGETIGTLYTGAISIGSTTTIRAMAYKSGDTDSTVTSATYTITAPPPPQVATPAFSPAGGAYSSAQSVALSDSTSGASIRYTTDGSAPSETAGTLYSGPISIGATTTIKAIGYKSGDTDSAIASATYTIGSSSGCITATAGGGWKNNPMASQTGTFTATFDATPSAGPTNAVVALSNGAQTSYSNFPCLARFNPTGDIDARNGGAYAATTVIPYAAGVTYHFRMVVNVSAQTYSIYVTPAGGSELTVGLNYTFRVSATSLSNWGAYVDGSGGTGTLTVCNFSIGGSGPTPFTIAASAGANGSISPSGNITVDQGATQTFVVTPNSGYVVAAVTVDGSSAGQVTSYTFNNVQANHTISVTFQQSVPTTFTITATAAVNGSISPSGNIVVNQGASQSFTITPSSSYTVASVTVDGSSVGAVTSYTFNNVQANHTINAVFQASGGGCVTATVGGGWKNNPMAAETGTFTDTFDATPSASPTNAVVALSNGAQTSYSNFPCLVRFNPSGDIDARNGGAYAAATAIPYSAGVTYHFRLVVNVSAQTYSIYVTPAGGSELTVGLNYAFRVSATSLSNWGVYVDSGSGGTGTVAVCNFSL